MLIQLITNNRAMRIKKYGDEAVSAFLVGYTLFYQDLLPHLEYIILDIFYATGILTSGATQFEKMTTQSKNGIPVNYSNDD